METNKQQIFQKLGQIISEFFAHPEYFSCPTDKLEDIFWDNFSQVMQIALDLNLSVDSLQEFSDKYHDSFGEQAVAEFLAVTLENENTYALLNYFLYKFIQSCLVLTKKDQTQTIENFLGEKISESDLDNVVTDYQNLVQQTTATGATL